LIWIFYVLPIVLGINLSPIASGVIALSLNAGAFLAEVFRGGIESIGRGQRDAASVLGMSKAQGFSMSCCRRRFGAFSQRPEMC
jgi:ABC-type amino acid transport system permease subunit